MPITVAYWDIRGLLQPIRLVLELCKADYVEKRYSFEVRADGSLFPGEWIKDKQALGLDFPNLPYLIDDKENVKLSESTAVIRYCAGKYRPEMLGRTLRDQAIVSMLGEIIGTYRGAVIRCAYSQDQETFNTGLEALKAKTIPEFFTSMLKFLKTDYLLGDYITYVDMMMYELSDQTRLMVPGIFDTPDFEPVKKFLDRIEAVPEIKAYMASERFISRPVNNKMAAWK